METKTQPSIIPYCRQWIQEDDIAAVSQALLEDFVTQGPQITAFSKAIAKQATTKHAVIVSSGTAALHTAVSAMDIAQGAAGITSAITFAASANCLLYNNADAFFADVDPLTGLVTPETIEDAVKKIESKYSKKGVIIPVSLKGETPDLPAIQKIAHKYNYWTLEDAAHSLGGFYQDNQQTFYSGSCSHTDAAIFSFHPLKHICTGEGGAVLTNDGDLAYKADVFKTHGIHRPFVQENDWQKPAWHSEQIMLGYHYRMTDFQAALGLSQLKKLPMFLDKIRKRATRYHQLFEQEPFAKRLQIPPHSAQSAYHLFVVHFESEKLRNQAFLFLRERNIYSQVHYLPVYKHPYYENRFGKQSLPGAEAYFKGCLSIPIYPQMTDTEQDRVVEGIKDFLENN